VYHHLKILRKKGFCLISNMKLSKSKKLRGIRKLKTRERAREREIFL
jgi:hypothetical protein